MNSSHDASTRSAVWNSPLFFGVVAFLAVAAIIGGWVHLKFGINVPPSATGDEISYDSIAWELANGRGFSVGFDDPVFRKPYDDAAAAAPELFSVPEMPSGPVAFRPPLYPLLLASGNALVGRQFWVGRTFNIFCIAALAGTLAAFLHRRFGALAAVVGIVLLLADTRSRLFARTLLTEPLACLLTAVLATLFVNYHGRLRRPQIVMVAVTAGLLVMTRSITVVWLPGICWLILRARPEGVRLFSVDSFRQLQLFVFCVLMVLVPWGVRNSLLSGRFMPMGTQGMMELAAGYSDEALAADGVWQNLQSTGVYNDVVTADMTNIQRELAIADASRAQAATWARNNLSRLPTLAGKKLLSEFRPRSPVEWVISGLAVLGAILGLRDAGIRLMLWLLAFNAVAVACTWSVEGRFLVPQLFLFYCLAASVAGRIFAPAASSVDFEAGRLENHE